jgi:hypothetical protein
VNPYHLDTVTNAENLRRGCHGHIGKRRPPVGVDS